MKRKLSQAILILAAFTLLIRCEKLPKVCTIKGELIGVERPSIFLFRLSDDIWNGGIEVPVKEGKFEYSDTIEAPEVYEIFLQRGGGRPQSFVLEEGIITITLHNERDGFENNKVEGGKLNLELDEYKKSVYNLFEAPSKLDEDSRDVLIQNNEYYSDTIYAIFDKQADCKSIDEYKRLENLKKKIINSGNGYTKMGAILEARHQKVGKQFFEWKYDYINKNQNAISYYLLYRDLLYYRKYIDTAKVITAYQKLSEKVPNHCYNKPVGELINSLTEIKVGKKYINFSAPDINGNEIKISDIINNKIALIDLWSIWCGGCIKKSKSMVPIYEEYKNDGFTIVGVAGDYKNMERLKNALEKYKFPWVNLIELDKEKGIWNKYGIPNAGGGTFLVDRNGIILAISPTAKEVKNILDKKLK
jgi:peroxiredoxin